MERPEGHPSPRKGAVLREDTGLSVFGGRGDLNGRVRDTSSPALGKCVWWGDREEIRPNPPPPPSGKEGGKGSEFEHNPEETIFLEGADVADVCS